MSGNRRLPDNARAAFASLYNVEGFADVWSRTLSELPKTMLRECERLIGLEEPNAEFRERISYAVSFRGVVTPHRRYEKALSAANAN
jgi:hypothetical protein